MLIARRNEVEKANVALEQKVRERTLALSAATRELERLARRDALTGLWNRLSANERLEEEFLRMKHTKQPYSVLLRISTTSSGSTTPTATRSATGC